MKASQHLRAARASTLSYRPKPARLYLPRQVLVLSSTSFRPPLHPHQRISPLSTTKSRSKGLQPDSSDPEPPKTESPHTDGLSAGPVQISDADYHETADQYLNTLVLALEELTEKTSDGVEVEFSVRVHFSRSGNSSHEPATSTNPLAQIRPQADMVTCRPAS